MPTTKIVVASQFYRVPVHTTGESFPISFTSTLEHPQLSLKQYRTQVVPNRPGLVIVKMNVSFPVCFGEECVCQDPSGPIKRQVVSMPVPGGKTRCTSDKGPWNSSVMWPMVGATERDGSSHSHPKFILPVQINCSELFQLTQTKFCIRALRKQLDHTKH